MFVHYLAIITYVWIGYNVFYLVSYALLGRCVDPADDEILKWIDFWLTVLLVISWLGFLIIHYVN